MAAALLLTGGPDYAHDFSATGGALAALMRSAGHTVETVDHPDVAAERLTNGPFDLLVVNALRWRMLGEQYAPWRDQWAYMTPPDTRAAIERFVGAGGGLIGNHTAPICFDDWPGWGDVLGGAWNWERSAHPPPASVRVRIHTEHPVVAGLGDGFEMIDEVYGDLDLRPDISVLATARRTPDDADQPVVWAHRYGNGRVVYDGFGHDGASLEHPAHARLLRQAVDWAIGAA